MRQLKILPKLLKRHFCLYKWYSGVDRRRKRYTKQRYDTDAPRAKNNDKIVIIMCDGLFRHGGFTDRIRGATAIYQLCKELDVDFRISFTSPFELRKILVPNQMNWQIEQDEISFNSLDSVIYTIKNQTYNFSVAQQKRLIIELINAPYKQIHIYSNADFTIKQNTYASLFKELFSPCEMIDYEIKSHIEILRDDYICVASRFCALLGDPIDTTPVQLTQKQRLDYIERCIEHIENIHNQYPDQKILVTSDSNIFASAVKRLPYVYTIEGNRANIDEEAGSDFLSSKSAILDYMLISRASMVFQIKGTYMYSGFFSRSAASLNGAPYKLIEFTYNI